MIQRVSGKTAMKRNVLILGGFALALAGCDPVTPDFGDTYVPQAHYEKYPIKVEKAPVKMDVAALRGGLSQSQADSVRRFAQQALSNRASVIHVRKPSGGGRAASVAGDILNVLESEGIPSSAVAVSTYGGSATSPVLVSYVRAVAVTRECGEWSGDFSETSGNSVYENFGCAQQHNIAAMVADPHDLEVPKPMTPSDAARRSQMFKDYREPKNTATPAEQQQQIAISTVAQ
jgi:pilus assembly protein CpaD